MNKQQLRETVANRLAAAGMAIEKVPGGHAAEQLWRFTQGPHTGETIRLRTNQGYAVMSKAESPDVDAMVPSLAAVQWTAFACVNDDTGEAEVYLMPAPRLMADMQAAHRAACAHRESSGSDVRILYLTDKRDRAWFGFARKYREFRVGEPVVPGHDAIRRAQQIVADEFHVSPDAVHISVDLTPSGGPHLSRAR